MPLVPNPAKKRPVAGCPHTHCGPEEPWPGIGQSIRTCENCGTTISRPDPTVEGYEEALAAGDFEGYKENPSYPLLPPKGKGLDLWDHLWRIGKNEFKSMPRTWDPEYDSDVRQAFDTQIQRLIESMREDDSQKLRDIEKDGYLKLMRLPFDEVKQRGDYRYDSSDLAAVIEEGSDLVPISVGARGEDGPYWVLDGHHRLRAYDMAGKPALAFVAWTGPKEGTQAQLHIDMGGFVENPPWSDNLIAENMDEMIESGLPFPTGPGEELGEGHYGVVYATSDPEVVFKVTSDPTEAAFIKKATPLGWPQGIVKYKAIIDFEGEYRGRKTFGIWREAAFPVGLYKADANTAYDERNKREFEAYIQLFRRTAALARDTIKKKPKMLEYATSEKGKRWAWDTMDYDWIDPRVQGNKIYSHRMAHQPLARFTGWQRIAISLRACEALAQMMEHNNPMSQSVGATFGFYLDNDILLADVHGNNVGLVKRDDDYGEQTLWVITDPGHAVFLDEL